MAVTMLARRRPKSKIYVFTACGLDTYMHIHSSLQSNRDIRELNYISASVHARIRHDALTQSSPDVAIVNRNDIC